MTRHRSKAQPNLIMTASKEMNLSVGHQKCVESSAASGTYQVE